MVWDMGVGDTLSAPHRGIWQRLLNPGLPDTAEPVRLLPYTQMGSPGHRLAGYLGRLGRWWRVTFWPEAHREFSTLVAVLGLALLLGVILGRNVLALVLFSVVLSWLAAFSQGPDIARDPAQPATGLQGRLAFVHALGEFGVPWLVGAMLMGRPPWAAILLGLCYTITYFGLIGHPLGFRLVGGSQAAAVLLVGGLRYPLTAGAMAILLMPQWGLHAWAAYSQAERREVFNTYLRAVQPFVILSMLLAALTVAS
jgi:hypothetical protein